MPWIDTLSQELPRLRLYASASLGSPAAGDLAVEQALRELLDTDTPGAPDRTAAFQILDRRIRQASRQSDSDRIELLKHIAGFKPEEANTIVNWDGETVLRSAG